MSLTTILTPRRKRVKEPSDVKMASCCFHVVLKTLCAFASLRETFLFAAVCLLSIAAGCSKGDRPALGMVSGVVTLDGKPIEKARLIFEPIEGGRASIGSTDADGRYELIYIRKDKGAKVGPHRVRITVTQSDDDAVGPVPVIPEKFNRNTTLQATVKPGENECDFKITST
jgi:hypothetical protein